MASGRENKDNKVSLVHHLNDLNRLIQVLNFLLYPVTARVVLDNFKPCLCRHSKVFLTLIRWDHFDGGCVRWNVSLHYLTNGFFIDKTLLCLNHLSCGSSTVLRHGTHFLPTRLGHSSDCLIDNSILGFVLFCGWHIALRLLLLLSYEVSHRCAWLLLLIAACSLSFYHYI